MKASAQRDQCFFPIMVLTTIVLWLQTACRYVDSIPDAIQWSKTAMGYCCVGRGVVGYSWGRVVWVEVEVREVNMWRHWKVG